MRAIEVEHRGTRGHVSIPLDGSPLLQGLCKSGRIRRCPTEAKEEGPVRDKVL